MIFNKKLDSFYEGKKIQGDIINVLKANIDEEIIKNREVFDAKLKELLKDLKLKNALYKAVLMSLSERDSTADYCMKGKNKEADTNLRDTETIPLSTHVSEYKLDTQEHISKESENIKAYLEREVSPHVDEYWIDETKTRIGYEIPFTRYFYEYEELRPFKDIMEEIKELEQEIQTEIAKVIE